MGLCFVASLNGRDTVYGGKEAACCACGSMQAFAFTSWPQKHQHQWNYSPPGISRVRFCGTRVSQHNKSKSTAKANWGLPVKICICPIHKHYRYRTKIACRGDRPRSPASVRVAIYVESNAFSQLRHGRSGTIAPTKSFDFYHPLQQQIGICTTHRGFDSAQPPGPLPERSRRQHLRQICIYCTHKNNSKNLMLTL